MTNSQDLDIMQQGQMSNNIAEDVATPVMKNSTEAPCQHPSLPPLEVDNDQQKENAVEYHSRDKLENAASSADCENDDKMLRNPHEQHNQRTQTQEAREPHPNNVTSSQNIALNGGEQHQSQIKSEDLSSDAPPPPTIPPFYPEQQQHGQPANSQSYYYPHPHPSHYYSSDQRLNYNHQPPPPLHVPGRNGHSFHEHPPPPYPGHPPYNYSQSAPHYPPPPPSQPHYPQVQHPPYQQNHRPYQYPPHHHSSFYPPTSNNNHGFNYDRPTYHFSLPSDTQSLSDRQCYIRSNLIELFIATEHDVATRPARGQQKIHVGQVGIRCVYCAVNNTADRMDGRKPFEPAPPSAERAACYPQSVNRIYQTVADMQRRHFDKCRRIPVQVMGTYKSLKTTRPRGKIKPQEYWASSAEEIGLVNSEGMGIRVREDGEGKMVNQFLMQRKSVDGGVYGEDVVHCSNDNELTAAVQDGGEGDGMPPPKRIKSMNGGNENNSGGEGQSSSQNNNGGQKTSYSDAHLLASMRDGASPSEMKNSENGEVAAPQLKKEEEEEDKRKEMKLVSTPI